MDCASYLISAARQMHGAVGVLACFEDAARLGKPAREVVVYSTWSMEWRKGSAMPSQVLCVCVPPGRVARCSLVLAAFVVSSRMANTSTNVPRIGNT